MPKYKLMADGRYMTRVWDGTYKDGKKHYKAIYSRKSSRDLELKVIEFCANVKAGGETINSSSTFYEYACDWVNRSKLHTEKSTQYRYRYDIERLFKDLDCPLNAINAREIQNIINQNVDKPRLCQSIRLVVKQVLKTAELEHFIPRGKTDDIFALLSFPKYRPKEKRPLTDLERKAIAEADFTDFERAFVLILYYTGIRREEILALTAGDIQGSTLRINKAVGYESSNNPYLKVPKSQRGTRVIPIPSALLPVVNSYIAGKSKDELIFPGEHGLMTSGEYVGRWNKIKAKLCAISGEKTISPHLFRHNYCTMLCYQSISNHTITTKKIAELLGDTEKMVIEVYSHIVAQYEHPEESIEEALKL